MNVVMEVLPGPISWIIVGLALAHAGLFCWLRSTAKKNYDSLYQLLKKFTGKLTHQSELDQDVHIADKIEAFIADIRDFVVRDPDDDQRKALRDRINTLDENRAYLNSMTFEKYANVSRTVIEVYPLLGIFGTILAVGTALPAIESQQDAAMTVIMSRFGAAIWSTVWGLGAAMILMAINSWLEPDWSRLVEIRASVREVVAQAKRELTGFQTEVAEEEVAEETGS